MLMRAIVMLYDEEIVEAWVYSVRREHLLSTCDPKLPQVLTGRDGEDQVTIRVRDSWPEGGVSG